MTAFCQTPIPGKLISHNPTVTQKEKMQIMKKEKNLIKVTASVQIEKSKHSKMLLWTFLIVMWQNVCTFCIAFAKQMLWYVDKSP